MRHPSVDSNFDFSVRLDEWALQSTEKEIFVCPAKFCQAVCFVLRCVLMIMLCCAGFKRCYTDLALAVMIESCFTVTSGGGVLLYGE